MDHACCMVGWFSASPCREISFKTLWTRSVKVNPVVTSRWQHPAALCPPLISCPRVFSRRCCIQWRIEMFGVCTHIGSMGWLGACSSPLHSTFKHAVPVNRTAAGSAHESTVDRQNGSWHILAGNAKHNLANSCLGKWAFTKCTSRQIYTDLLNDCSNFTIALK